MTKINRNKYMNRRKRRAKKVRIALFSILALAILAGVGYGIFCLLPSHLEDGVKELEKGNYKKAITCFENQLEEQEQEAEAYRGMGIAYYELGEYEQAIEAFAQMETEGGEPMATTYQMLGNCHMKLQQYKEAIAAFDKGIEMTDNVQKNGQEMRYNQIIAYEYLAKWEKAKTCMEEYLKLYPDDENAQREAEFLLTR